MTDHHISGFLPAARGFCLLMCLVLGTAVGLSQAYRSGDVKLVGGADQFEGTVMVMSRGIWKSVCGLGWDVLDATVVCRQLGFRGIRRFFRWTKYGDGNLNRLKVKFSCRGNENNLIGCPRRLRRNTRLIELCAGKGRSAAVVCKGDRTTTASTTTMKITTPKPTTTTKPITTTKIPPTTTTATKKIRTKEDKVVKKNKIITEALKPNKTRQESKSKTEVNVANNLKDKNGEILKDEGTGSNSVGSSSVGTNLKEASGSLSGSTDHKDDKETIPSAGSSDSEDKEVKEKKKINVKEPEEKKKEDEEGKEKEKEKEKVKEEEKERKKTRAHTDNSSDRKEQKKTQIPEPEKEKESSVDQSKDNQGKEKYKVSLNGGRYSREGHVAIKLPGAKKWGVVCGDHWTYFEGKVVCRQLGLGLIKKIYTMNYYGGAHLPKLFARIRCHGNESHLADCEQFEYFNQVKCSKTTSVAAIICASDLPDLVPDAKALQESIRLEDRPLYYLTCSMEENCLADEAYEIKERSQAWITASRRLLRFSSIVYNKGTADFIPDSPKDAWEWHQCHMHYHSMDVFAHYDIMDLQGNRVAQGHKASFCLEDTRCPPGITPKYNCLGFGDQGLSVNCSDNYYHDIDCQWIDITGMKYGNYILKVEFNPHMSVSEITYDNNVVECNLYYTGTYAYLRKCNIGPLLRSD